MFLAKLFHRNKTPDSELKSLVKENNALSPSEKLEFPNHPTNQNLIYPFHTEKATSFPPPLLLDAAVHANPQTIIAKSENPRTFQNKNENIKKNI